MRVNQINPLDTMQLPHASHDSREHERTCCRKAEATGKGCVPEPLNGHVRRVTANSPTVQRLNRENRLL